MKKLLLIVAVAGFNTAHAATAYLTGMCTPETSVTGRLIYVGTYSYGGQQIQRAFNSMCPMSIEVY